MAGIVSSQLHPQDVWLLLHKLTPSQSETISGGYVYLSLRNITGGVNNSDNTYYTGSYSLNFHDNRFYTMDYSRSIYNWFYL